MQQRQEIVNINKCFGLGRVVPLIPPRTHESVDLAVSISGRQVSLQLNPHLGAWSGVRYPRQGEDQYGIAGTIPKVTSGRGK